MNGDQEAANHAVNAPISRWTNYGDLVRYGWELEKDRETDGSMGQALLEISTFEALNIDADQNKKFLITQSRPVTLDGRQYKVSDGYYQSLFNAAAGMIVVDDVISPENAKHPDIPIENIVPLRQWSDVVFLLWDDSTKGAPGGLRHVIMRQAIGGANGFADWDKYSQMQENGRTFRPGSDEYYALLYSPNARGIGWLLTQHKTQMGLLTVSSITVFGEDGEAMLYFKIDPAEQSD
ncbi:hypothetical protein BDV30DRAFT_224558 [Aspergillus minisclerotigenes]|uniref:Uncharacterized protein n=1 Tax=Aspergillus minisclerotigenes TaxID=656917 RepID=A0A5N6JE27_9EURO|nr:hypothetical protein BDV30DRAFT_224558 [Aspergillus minisclerotigenes]